MKDRFGEPPQEVHALLMQNQIRCLAEEAGFDKVETVNQNCTLGMSQEEPIKRWNSIKMLEKSPSCHLLMDFEVEGKSSPF